MDWHSHFQKVFFETWQNAGLPNHHEFLHEYYTLLEQYEDENEFIKKSSAISPGVDHTKLYAVYGFGVAVGKIFADMLDVSPALKKHTSDWCGRFNLGISLFDYICDELDGLQNVTSLQVFQPFTKTSFNPNRNLTPAEELLDNLAGSVLHDLKKAGSEKNKYHKTNLLFSVLKRLFEAQSYISKERLSSVADLKKIRRALYLKSAEPFRVMAEYTACMADPHDQKLIKKARSIGKAIGCCYWLIDDAKDVWIDLEAKQWNLFILSAIVEYPEIFEQSDNVFAESSLTSALEQSSHARRMSKQIIKRLQHAISYMELSKETEHHTLGLVSASLWQWYNG
ncbi:MAG TPA: hypothetical protein VIJ92_02250 [Ginsengibacter sp.]